MPKPLVESLSKVSHAIKSCESTRRPLGDLNLPWRSLITHWIGSAYLEETSIRLLDRPLLGIVSSHNAFNAFASEQWQSALMSALSFARMKNASILYSAASPYSEAIRNACLKLKVNNIRIDLRNPKSPTPPTCADEHLILIDRDADTSDGDMRSLPYLDRVIVALSHSLFVVDIDPKGRIAKLVDKRLDAPLFPDGSVFLAHSSCSESTKKIRWIQSQLDRGAVSWIVRYSEHQTAPNLCHINSWHTHAPIFPLQFLADSKSNHLIHCTRARKGPWPDQSHSQFYDELLIEPWVTPPSALDSLKRILTHKRLIASSHLKSGRTPTISFTARSLPELLASRTFESHLARWDWEPYGLMISKEWLAGNGCKPVVYLNRDELKRISSEDLVFSQPYSDSTSPENKARDWRVEQEWRLPSDLRLHQIPFSKAIVFVKHQWEAHWLSTVSNWPICYVGL